MNDIRPINVAKGDVECHLKARRRTYSCPPIYNVASHSKTTDNHWRKASRLTKNFSGKWNEDKRVLMQIFIHNWHNCADQSFEYDI